MLVSHWFTGLYRINGKRKHQPGERRSFKQAACTHVKDLLCNGNVERTSRNTTTNLPSDVYSRFEDSLSTTSLSTMNQSQHDDHVNFAHEQTRGCRSVSGSSLTMMSRNSLDYNTNLTHRSPSIEMRALELDVIASNDVSSNANDVTTLDGNSNVGKVTSSQYENTTNTCNDVSMTSLNSNTETDNMTSSAYVPGEDIQNATNTFNDVDVTSSNRNSEVANMTSSQYVQNEVTQNATIELHDVSMASLNADTDKVASPNDVPKRESMDNTDGLKENMSRAILKNNCRDDIIPNAHVINEITA